ncbi:MAG: aminodeoxychorismate lyase [Gammaproteobacteria bacterium]|nr:aminodeoxychorismate lyase [Gammaproteobacteria bacterium]
MLVNGIANDALSIVDRGLLYGDGVFETILCEAGRPILLAGHTQRLENGCKRLGLAKQNLSIILSDIREVAQQEDCVVKVIITRGERNRGYAFDKEDNTSTRIVYRDDLPSIPVDYYQEGIQLTKCEYLIPDNAPLAGIKHLNRLDQVMARSEWNTQFQEGIMLSNDGRVVEGTMTNIFIESDQKWFTPILETSGILGVMRQWLMRNCFHAGIECVEKDIQLSEFKNAQSIFVCNSVVGIWPVTQFEGKTYPVSEAVSKMMQQANSSLTKLYPV